ncbi:MAG: hypothetical protein H0T79_04105 [Deltaproteobacteria bacterium]|nr:hypothetical protein [Deltaproteobacteria bacterium]
MGNRRGSIIASSAAIWLLAGCPTVDLGDTPADLGLCNPAKGFEFFQTDVWPKFILRADKPTASCVRTGGGCHDPGGGNALTFQTNPIDDAANYRAAQVYLNCGTQNMSELLTKPLQGIDDPHGGGNIFTSVDDPAVQVFLDWFQ